MFSRKKRRGTPRVVISEPPYFHLLQFVRRQYTNWYGVSIGFIFLLPAVLIDIIGAIFWVIDQWNTYGITFMIPRPATSAEIIREVGGTVGPYMALTAAFTCLFLLSAMLPRIPNILSLGNARWYHIERTTVYLASKNYSSDELNLLKSMALNDKSVGQIGGFMANFVWVGVVTAVAVIVPIFAGPDIILDTQDIAASVVLIAFLVLVLLTFAVLMAERDLANIVILQAIEVNEAHKNDTVSVQTNYRSHRSPWLSFKK